jgi:hypothetical protein
MESEIIYIYENIELINNHNNFIRLLNINKCKYTKNNNGMFVNLKTLDSDIIHNIFLMIKSELKTQNNIYDIVNNDAKSFIKENNEETSGDDNNNTADNIYDNNRLINDNNRHNIYNNRHNIYDNNRLINDGIKITDFTKDEQSIIVLSKKHKL